MEPLQRLIKACLGGLRRSHGRVSVHTNDTIIASEEHEKAECWWEPAVSASVALLYPHSQHNNKLFSMENIKIETRVNKLKAQ